MTELYPWLSPLWNEWKKSLEAGRFPNSSIVNAPLGLGVEKAVDQLTASLMCINYESEACGFCHSCELMKSGSHPDFHVISPEKEGKAITVDQIRSSNRWAQESSQLNGLRVIVVSPAEAMNESASNALLKTLEEPSSECVFILVSQNSHRLMPTIVSRCQQFSVATPSLEVGGQWLKQELGKDVPDYVLALNDNAPLLAKAMVGEGGLDSSQQLFDRFLKVIQRNDFNLMQLASEIAKDSIVQLSWLWHLLSDVQKVHFGIQSQSILPSAQALSITLSYQAAHKSSSQLLVLLEQLKQHPGLNTELLIMNWLISICEETCS